jgi:hypothetical protein
VAAVGQGPMRWLQLPDIGVVGNGGVLVKYKGIAEAISVDEQPRMEGNDAVYCRYWRWRAILRPVGFYPAL